MARRRGSVDQGFARFMRAATSSRPSPHVESAAVPAFSPALEWHAFIGMVTAALAKMPANERTAFFAAMAKRAHDWAKTPAGETPRDWPIVVRVERSPLD